MSRQSPFYPLGYQPPARAGGRMRFSWSVFITTAYVLGIYAAFFLIVVPQLGQNLAGFGVAMPWSTALVLEIGRRMNPWGTIGLIAIPPTLGALVPLMLPWPTDDDPTADRRAARWWARGIRILLLVLLMLMMAALFMPMLDLIQGISSAH